MSCKEKKELNKDKHIYQINFQGQASFQYTSKLTKDKDYGPLSYETENQHDMGFAWKELHFKHYKTYFKSTFFIFYFSFTDNKDKDEEEETEEPPKVEFVPVQEEGAVFSTRYGSLEIGCTFLTRSLPSATYM